MGTRAGHTYLTFDEDVSRGVAAADPAGFVADLPPRVILDEVPHLPRSFSALKVAIDRDHFRDRDGFEVDIVIERGMRAVAGGEVKAGATVTRGVVLYDGETTVGFGDLMYAVPIRALWEPR